MRATGAMWMGLVGLALGVVFTLAFGSGWMAKPKDDVRLAAEQAIGTAEAQCIMRSGSDSAHCVEQASAALAALH